MLQLVRALATPGLLALLSLWPAHAQEPSNALRPKTISLYVGFGPGGGYDAYAQLVAQHMGRYLPGNPTLVVRHMPGGGSLVLANYLAKIAPPDGSAIGLMAGGAAFAPLIGSADEKAAAKFDPRLLTWLGSLESFTPIAIAWQTSGFRTLDDAKARELRFGSSGPSSGGEAFAKLMNETLGTKFRAIRGYKGSNDITLAMERGEVEGFVGWCWACMKADRPQYVTEKKVALLAQIGLAREPEMGAAPHVLDLIVDPDDQRVARLILANLAIGRPFAAPPAMPQTVADDMRHAFAQAARDPGLLALAAKSGRKVDLYDAAQIDDLLRWAYGQPPEIVARASKIINSE
ncbi:MAG: tripartite tricarboxylate transporter family receptor [Hyphomicrobiales bacterium]|nr:tripartite tricarboxylate transporter family receptor [Hyphomicrobiales bacterium]